ncbi:MAG: hypothetical protein A3F10_02360 [Coxiella sp. RIFCSPHIGHO2_12_FULL_42_15]|nr:MAG: hypothetical protein A3F10_02360 [Coxiella sp. RIFCSPHIGHO2_12_FULL_42_15]
MVNKTSDLSHPTDFSQQVHRPLTEAITLSKSTSKAFDIQHSINPLIAAAAPLLMVITTLKKHALHADPTHLYQALLQEIKTFENKTRKLDYRSPIILAARYLLCAFIDEILSDAQENLQKSWQQSPFLQILQNETWGGERFFVILERAADDAQTHVDLLELGSLCLSLGYQGKYRKPEFPKRELENVTDNLLILIHRVRGNPPVSLFVKNTGKANIPIICKRGTKKIPHRMIAIGIFIIGTLGIYIPYKTHLSHVSKPVAALMIKDSVGQND